MKKTDVVIIGAGPVGLFAVHQLGIKGLKAVVIDNLNKIMIKSDKINDSTNWLPILRVHPNGNLFLEWEKI